MGKMYLLDNVINNQTNQVEGYCIIKNISEKIDKKGNTYLDLELSDASGNINAKIWDYNKELHGDLKQEMIVKVRATVTTFRDTDQLRIDRIRKYDAQKDITDMTKLLPCAPLSPTDMYSELISCAEAFSNKELTKLVKYMLNERKENLLQWPAALKLHHAYRGGLLYHTLTMKKVAASICDVYPALNRDIVFAGIILHDLAKMDELIVGETGLASAYTTRGQLLGHIAMGVAGIETAAKETGVSEEVKTLMQHIILSHHNLPEYGSPKSPMFPEAEVVSTVDMLDARMFEMFDILDNVEVGGFSPRQQMLDNRMLYKTTLKQ